MGKISVYSRKDREMKKVILVIVLCLIACMAWAQQELTEDQQKQYNREKLTITVSLQGNTVNLDSGIGMFSGWKTWNALQGFEAIEEPAFFELTGYDDEAEQASKHHNAKKSQIGIGIFGNLIGIIMLVAADPLKDNTGLYIAAGGVTAASTGILLAGMTKQNWAPAEKAVEIADAYNRKLLAKFSSTTQ